MASVASVAAPPPHSDAVVPDGAIVLIRHAIAPGGGDPPGMRLDDCATQRNLDAQGREQARQIGDALRRKGVRVAAVWTSQWCRTRETAALAFPGQKALDQPAFNSFFGNPSAEPAQTAQARTLLKAWRGPGVLVVVTHQVNITALTGPNGITPASGEGVILRLQGGEFGMTGRLAPPALAAEGAQLKR